MHPKSYEATEFERARKDDSHLQTGSDISGPSISAYQYLESRTRWGVMAMSAILRCAEDKNVGLRKFLEFADLEQRQFVGQVAKEHYANGLGLTEDTLETFMLVTMNGITGAGFEYGVDAGSSEEVATLFQYKCPIIDHANLAGYPNGDPALADLSLWCDTYDNFESAAVAPSQIMVHTHCLGRCDTTCQFFAQEVPNGLARKPGEHIYDYTARMRDTWRAQHPDVLHFVEDKSEAELEAGSAEVRAGMEAVQDKLFPTLVEKKKRGSDNWGQIGAISTAMAGNLIGWDRFIEGMSEKQGPLLFKKAEEKVKKLGLKGDTVHDAASLHMALITGQGYGAHDIIVTDEGAVEGTCYQCPVAENVHNARITEGTERLIDWCNAAASYETKAIADDITQTFTHCIGKGDKACRWVIEKTQ